LWKTPLRKCAASDGTGQILIGNKRQIIIPMEDYQMSENRRHYQSKEKVKILRRHLIDRIPVSDICNEIGISPTIFYKWQKEFFENGAVAFERKSSSSEKRFEKQIAKLKEKIAYKDGVIAEIMEEHIELKKNIGEI